MDHEHRSKLDVDLVNGLLGASEVVPGAIGETPSDAERLPEPEVAALDTRQRFSAGYKRRIERAAAACMIAGEGGTLRSRHDAQYHLVDAFQAESCAYSTARRHHIFGIWRALGQEPMHRTGTRS